MNTTLTTHSLLDALGEFESSREERIGTTRDNRASNAAGWKLAGVGLLPAGRG